MRYISVCSGIEAASVAWKPLGWEAVAFAEIEPFPNAVLAHHFPDVPNVGDISNVDWRPYRGTVDLVVGGTPCQSFSVAGKREGMDGASGLVREYFRLLSECKPKWFCWENVPGVISSNGGDDWLFILREWHKLGYHVAYRVLDAQYAGVPQRRRRLFAVGYLGDWRDPVKVLFECYGLSRHPAPGRKKRKADTACTGDGIAGTVTNKWHKASGGPAGDECYNLVCADIAPTIGASGPPYSRPGNERIETEALVCQAPCVLQDREGKPGGGKGPLIGEDKSFSLRTNNYQTLFHHGVRRLTPTECERLQGFPDGWTDIPYRGKPAPDGARYKALGNSMAVPCMAWIGRRIQMVEDGEI